MPSHLPLPLSSKCTLSPAPRPPRSTDGPLAGCTFASAPRRLMVAPTRPSCGCSPLRSACAARTCGSSPAQPCVSSGLPSTGSPGKKLSRDLGRLRDLLEGLLDHKENEERHHRGDVNHPEARHHPSQGRKNRLRDVVKDANDRVSLVHREPTEHGAQKNCDFEDDDQDVGELKNEAWNRTTLRVQSNAGEPPRRPRSRSRASRRVRTPAAPPPPFRLAT